MFRLPDSRKNILLSIGHIQMTGQVEVFSHFGTVGSRVATAQEPELAVCSQWFARFGFQPAVKLQLFSRELHRAVL